MSAPKQNGRGTMQPGPGEVITPALADGKPDAPDTWRRKMRSRAKMLAYLETGERYWYAEEGYGSERRKTKA